jgi:hypothetical protein
VWRSVAQDLLGIKRVGAKGLAFASLHQIDVALLGLPFCLTSSAYLIIHPCEIHCPSADFCNASCREDPTRSREMAALSAKRAMSKSVPDHYQNSLVDSCTVRREQARVRQLCDSWSAMFFQRGSHRPDNTRSSCAQLVCNTIECPVPY